MARVACTLCGKRLDGGVSVLSVKKQQTFVASVPRWYQKKRIKTKAVGGKVYKYITLSYFSIMITPELGLNAKDNLYPQDLSWAKHFCKSYFDNSSEVSIK
ncbi:hypothetical protein ACJX0J_041908, partial [Zea mays]